MVTNPGDLAEARERINRLRETAGDIKDYLLKRTQFTLGTS